MRTSRSTRIHAQLSGISVLTKRVEPLSVVGPEVIRFELFYDYFCPFVYRVSVLLQNVGRSPAVKLDVTWRYFSLAQVNSKDDGWTAWEAAESEHVSGRLAFKAAEAARRQGAFEQLHTPLLEARHRDRLDIDEIEVVERVAVDAGLDLKRFRKDVADPKILESLQRDHTQARNEHGVFGTPTFVFPNGASAYVRLAEAPDAATAPGVFDRLISIVAGEPTILEIKRPRRPSPERA
ncbi:MAG TPA: DsbA family protein [Candidatus Dormibacteraeota bacterium]|nr:DsbA family protein [Candidatus Dormibacteraeota bacterium]